MKYLNKTQLANKLQVSMSTVSNWMSHDDFPVHSKGESGTAYEFSIVKVSNWLKINGKAAKKQGEADYNEVRLEKLRAEYEIARMNADQLAGTLVPIDDVSDVVAAEYSIVRAHFRGLSNSLPPLLINKTEEEIAKIIAMKVDTILNELSQPEAILEGKTPRTPEEVPKATNNTATIRVGT